jgi:hypothetical protein
VLSIVELERRREDLEADIAHQSAAQEQQRKDTAQQVERERSLLAWSTLSRS